MAESVAGGAVGGFLAYEACNVVFGIPSAGTSLLWCGIIAGAAGGYLGGNWLNQVLENRAIILYEALIPLKAN